MQRLLFHDSARTGEQKFGVGDEGRQKSCGGESKGEEGKKIKT